MGRESNDFEVGIFPTTIIIDEKDEPVEDPEDLNMDYESDREDNMVVVEDFSETYKGTAYCDAWTEAIDFEYQMEGHLSGGVWTIKVTLPALEGKARTTDDGAGSGAIIIDANDLIERARYCDTPLLLGTVYGFD